MDIKKGYWHEIFMKITSHYDLAVEVLILIIKSLKFSFVDKIEQIENRL